MIQRERSRKREEVDSEIREEVRALQQLNLAHIELIITHFLLEHQVSIISIRKILDFFTEF